MATDKQVEIRITAKNLTEAELSKARQSVAGFARDTEGATQRTSGLGSALRNAGSMAGAFGLTLGIAGVVKFGKALLDDADALVMVSDKTGIAIEPLQRLKFAAEDSGNTFEQVTAAISMMQKRLASGDQSALEALKRLGLEFDTFSRLSPDQQFIAIAKEVAKVEDPMQRVKVATDLFGRAGADVLPTMVADLDKLGDAAAVMSEKATRAYDDIGTQLTLLWSHTKNTIGESLAMMLDGYGRLAGGLKALLSGDATGALEIFTDLAKRELPEVANAASLVHQPLKAIELNTKDVKAIEDQLEETRKKGIASAKAYATEQDRVAKVLAGLGLVSAHTGLDELAAIQDELRVATRIGGEAMQTAILALLPRLETLEDRARRSGVEIQGLAGMLHMARTVAEHAGDAFVKFDLALPTDSLQDLIAGTHAQSEQLDIQAVQTRILTDAYHHFGMQTPAELRKVATEAERAYRALLESGTATPAQLRAAYDQMVAAQIAATGKFTVAVQADWRQRILPGVTSTLGQLQTSVSGTFASMMLGAKGFKDGMLDIWGAIKASAVRIFAEIADAWIGGMLKRMLAALAGNKQAFAGGMASLLPFGALAGGSAAGGVPGATGAVIGPELGVGTGVLAPGASGTNWGAMAGGGMMAVGGALGLWQALQSGSKVGAAVSGASTGAGIGTMIAPGIGTAIGAGVGALGGWIASLFGPSKEAKANKAATEEIQQLKQQLLETYGTLEKIKALGPTGEAIADAWGSKSQAGLVHFKGLMTEFLETQERTTAALQKYGFTWEDQDQQARQSHVTSWAKELLADHQALVASGLDWTKVTDKQAAAWSELVQAAQRSGTTLPESVRPMIEHLREIGLLTTEDTSKVEELLETFTARSKDAVDTIAKLDDELAALNASEAPEEVMGIVEANTRARIDAERKIAEEKLAQIEQEKQEALKALETEQGTTRETFDTLFADVTVKSGEAAATVAEQWRKAPWEDWGPVPSAPGVPGYASGALITAPHLAMVGEGGERELIGPVGFMAEALAGALAMTGGGGGTRVVIENHTYLDGQELTRGMGRYAREITEFVAPLLPPAVKRYGVARRR